jgi:hypothetical protein
MSGGKTQGWCRACWAEHHEAQWHPLCFACGSCRDHCDCPESSLPATHSTWHT